MDGQLRPEDYMGLVVSIAKRMRVPPSVDIRDMVQDAMLALTEALLRFDKTRGVPVRAFVCQLARRRIIDYLRREQTQARRLAVSLDAEASQHADSRDTWHCMIPDPSPSVRDQMIRREAMNDARRLVAVLKPRERRLVDLHYWGDMELQEAGRRMGINRNYAYRIHFEALRRMRRAA
jgi:RNA polymerase sigma factor (sigma-70 family)